MLEKINKIADSFFDNLETVTKNEVVVMIGPICSGKTSYRKKYLEKTHIILDAAEIYLKLNNESAGGFGEHLMEELNFIGDEIITRILRNKYSFAVEIMPDQYKNIINIIQSLKLEGYKTSGLKFDCTEEEAIERTQKRNKNDISSYFTENFHIAWLLKAIK